ncbi:MFS transporter [Azospirillum sp. ST 5-10]|uniref:MFS transporter n=1 Tax=unclassified Azospirillum TaxID=2630922 RepID=UPI003F4A8286
MTTSTAGNRWLVLTILSTALVMITVDMTVLYTALPRLTTDLAATASEKLWIVNAYPLVMAGLLPGLGTLGDRLGHKRLFLFGLLVFGTASLIAAFAPAPSVLIGARALLAVGAAAMMPATLSIIRLIFPDERERSLAIGVWAATASGGAALGPLLGGILLEHFWWGSVFLINVPIVAGALVLAVLMVPTSLGHAARPWDFVGSLQILVGLVACAFAIKEVAKHEVAWAHAALALLVGCAAFLAFKRRQDRMVHKLVDFSLFKDWRFSSGVIAAVVAMLALVGFELALSQRLQLVLGLTPLQAGLFILPTALAAFFAGPLAGALSPRVGPLKVLWSGMLAASVGLALSASTCDLPLLWQIPGFTVLGAGLGFTMTAASTIIMANAPSDRAGMAASIEEVSFEFGGAIGVALLGSVLTAAYGMALAPPVGIEVPPVVFHGLDEALAAADGLPTAAAARLRDAARAAFDQAVVAVMITATILTLVTAIGIWLRARAAAAARA